MIKFRTRFLSKIITALFAVMLIVPIATAATNLPTGDIGDYGTWATDNNLEMFKQSITTDITQFQSGFQSEFPNNQLVKDFVPVEAKVGLAFMNALSWIGRVLDSSLVRFSIIFIIIGYAFWIMFEAYNMMTKGSSSKKLVEDVLKKGFTITIWIMVLYAGPAKIFMWVMGPIITIGTYLSDLILNAVANSAGAAIPDTCAAIREYTIAHTSPDMLIDARAAADIMCVPTRLSGFFYTAVAAGWQWIIAGIGHSAFTFAVGVIFVVVFIMNIWKFALMALGVIADLFLGILLLPFTAIAETLGKTSYKGIAGNIFNGFLGLFKVQSLSDQINRFIKAAVYFVSLSIVVAVCAAILSGVVDADLASSVPSLTNDGFIITLLTGLLVAYLANKADSIAKDVGGGASVDSSFGKQFGGDVKKLWDKVSGQTKNIAKIIREGGKK